MNYPLFWSMQNVFKHYQSFWDLHNAMSDLSQNFNADQMKNLGNKILKLSRLETLFKRFLHVFIQRSFFNKGIVQKNEIQKGFTWN